MKYDNRMLPWLATISYFAIMYDGFWSLAFRSNGLENSLLIRILIMTGSLAFSLNGLAILN